MKSCSPNHLYLLSNACFLACTNITAEVRRQCTDQYISDQTNLEDKVRFPSYPYVAGFIRGFTQRL